MWNLESRIFYFLFSRRCRAEYLFSLLPRPAYLFTKSAKLKNEERFVLHSKINKKIRETLIILHIWIMIKKQVYLLRGRSFDSEAGA